MKGEADLRAESAATGAFEVCTGAELLSGVERSDRKLSSENEVEADSRAEPAATGAFEVCSGAELLSGVERSDRN